MELRCPKCGFDGCYFDGEVNFCPDCEHEWARKGKSNSKHSDKEDEDLDSDWQDEEADEPADDGDYY